MNIPESIQRCDFLKQLGLASTAALATNGTQAWGNEDIIHPRSQGGFLHLDLDGRWNGGS